MPSERWILHADMDAFYASIEQRDNPALRGLPVIVGAALGRGVVAAASYEARRYGVRSAMPGFRARQLCPDGVFLPSNMARYAAVSRQIHQVFLEFTPVVEPLALDEAFLDVSGSAHLFGGALELGRALKQRVRETTELAVSVGIAPSKLVAKIACNLGKPDGLRITSPAEVRPLLAPLPISWLWGVGPVLERELVAAGFETLGALADCDPSVIEKRAGRRAAHWLELAALARGEDERPVEAEREPKSYGEENTFETDVTSERRILDALSVHADAVARRLRHDGYRGRTITLKIKLARSDPARSSARGPFYPVLTRSKTLPEPTDDAARISAVVRALWHDEQLGEPVRLLGVSLSGLSRDGSTQLGLFEPRPRELGPALDAINQRFGAGAIQRAVAAPIKITPGRNIKRGEG